MYFTLSTQNFGLKYHNEQYLFSSEKDTVKIVSCNAAGNCASVDTGRVIEHERTIPDGYSAIPKTGKTLLYFILDITLV
jgi:hypothetical protein